MSEDDKKIVGLFREAGLKLGFQFSTPHVVHDSDGTPYSYLGHIDGFGSEKGLLITGDEIPEGNSREREFALSLLGPESLGSVQDIREFLVHWGWYGPQNDRPEWAGPG